MRSLRRFLPTLLLLAPVLGCRGDSAPPIAGKLLVGVTIIPHAWLVQQIGGEHVAVVTLVRPGESAELYQPTDAQITRLMGASLYFCTGMPLESGRGFRAIRSSGKVQLVDLRQGIELHEMAGHADHGEGTPVSGDDHRAPATRGTGDPYRGKDPHVWVSPRLLKVQAQTVAQSLAQIDPGHRPEYLQNLSALHQRLDELDATLRKTLAPLRGRAMLVFHSAWSYFAEDYGLREIAIETEGKEPSDRELTGLQRLARKEGVQVVFLQRQTAGRAAKALAEAIGARTEVLDDLADDVPAALVRTAELLVASHQESRAP